MESYQSLLSAVTARGAPADYYALGCLLAGEKRWGAAAGCFAQVVMSEPDNGLAWANLGWNLHLSGRTERGEVCLRKSVGGTASALLSQVMLTLGNVEEAVNRARLAVELEPGAALNHMALSFALAAAGQWAEAWEEYEHRMSYKLPEFLTRPYRLWRGEEVEHLFLEGEQGAGDAIMALRWIPEAAKRADRVTLYVHGPLYSLVDSIGLPENVRVMPLPQPLPDAQAWCPLMSLPVALDLPKPWPGGRGGEGEGKYIDLDNKSPALDPTQIHIGIAWAGSSDHEQAHHRDCPLPYLLRLSEVPGVKLHSIQVGPRAQDLSDAGAYGLVVDRAPEITNYLDTARVIGGLDMVISVDTSVAHLAGAMGVPVWVLINQRGKDFRWPMTGDTTPWYPSMRFFRRALSEQWGDVVDRVEGALRKTLNLSHCPACGSLMAAGKCIRCEEDR